MNILVFGKDGQLGRAFHHQLAHPQYQNGNIFQYVGRNECDLKDSSQITNLLQVFNPQLIINAAAYTAVDKAETDSEIAFAINAVAPAVMAKYAEQHGATLLHFSTDYVFDGSKQGAYTELDQPNPLSVYGKSKEAGELAIANTFANNTNRQYAILRTSWLYGDGNNFIRTILRLAKERDDLRIISDQYGVPTSADWLAQVSLDLVLDSQYGLRKFTSGIYHAVPSGKTSWHGLASLVTQFAIDSGMPLKASLAAIKAIPTSAYPTAAPRPMNSCLSTKKLEFELERLGLVSKLPHWNTQWDEQVHAYLRHLVAD